MADKPRWAQSDDEWRLLVITFMGSLLSIIVGAGVLGGALALGRYFARTGSLASLAVISVVILVGSVVLIVAGRTHSAKSGWGKRIERWVNAYAIGVGVLNLSFLALTWVGIAAGVP